MPRPAHIVFACVGSQGDLFPFLAVGRELQRRGHRVTVATHVHHADAVRQSGLDFACASGLQPPDDLEAFTRHAFHPWHGPRFVVRDLAAADTAASHALLQAVCADADALVSTTLAFGAQILGHRRQLPWLSAVLAPTSFLSAHDPPATGIVGLDRWLRRSPRRGRGLRRVVERVSRPWTAEVRRYRRTLGLPADPPRGDPLHRGQHGTHGVLALFSPLLGLPQPDWPPATTLTGACRYTPPAAALSPELQAFLAAGPAPLVFTLGSAAVHAGSGFLRDSLHAARRLGRRAVLLTGSDEVRAQLPDTLPDEVIALDYAPHGLLFPRASVVVHHGGVGTSQEALAAGVPMLVVPHGFDQPDNAARLERLGTARVLPIRRYRPDRAADALRQLLGDADTQQHARHCGEALRGERGPVVAADRIEAVIAPR